MEKDYTIEDYLERPYWLIDILPKQVPANDGERYFAIEKFYLSEPQVELLCRKFANLLLKLYCYHDIAICGNEEQWIENPAPETLVHWVMSRQPIHVLLKSTDAMIVARGDDTYMTLYDPDEATL
jgi:hypothetical protein